MKFKIKKFIYLVNDVSSLILKRDIEATREKYIKLQKILITISILLLVSLVINIINIFK